jgi:hypothetical protein
LRALKLRALPGHFPALGHTEVRRQIDPGISLDLNASAVVVLWRNAAQ